MNEFQAYQPPPESNNVLADIPEEMDIYWRGEDSFLPEGKEFSDLTEAELKRLKSQYRFCPMRPGIYQGISGFDGMI